MKKIILLSMLVLGLLIIAGCTQEQLTQEEKEILGEDGAIAGQATYDRVRVNECRRDNECWSALLSCYRAECMGAADRGACINNCLDRAMGQEAPPFFVGISDESPASDNILATNIIVDLQNDGYEFEEGIVNLFSELEGTSLDNQVTLLIYNNEARIIIGENSPASHNLFATEVAEKLSERGIEMQNQVYLNTEVDTSNLMALFLEPTPPFFVGISDESPASDNILATNVIVDLQDDGYEFEEGIVQLFSELEGTSLDNQVTLLIYNGEAKIIVGENSPASHNLFATEIAEKLIARGVEMQNQVYLNTEVDTNNLMALFLEPTPPFIAAVDDSAPASDNLFMTDVLTILTDKGYSISNVARLFSEVEGTSLDNQVTLVVLDGKGRVVVGENSPASHNLFATDVALAVTDVQGRNLVKLSSEVDSNNLETAFRR